MWAENKMLSRRWVLCCSFARHHMMRGPYFVSERALLAQVFVTTAAVTDIDVRGRNRLNYDLWKNYVPAEITAMELK